MSAPFLGLAEAPPPNRIEPDVCRFTRCLVGLRAQLVSSKLFDRVTGEMDLAALEARLDMWNVRQRLLLVAAALR